MTAPLRRSGILVTTIERGCESKRRYSDEFGARALGQIVTEQTGIRMYLYPCKVCRGWHLTKQKQIRPDRAVDYRYTPAPR